jgi:O-succinylbenzoic acid--CoA ligase
MINNMQESFLTLFEESSKPPERPALVAPEVCLTYSQFYGAVLETAARLNKAGIAPYERIGILAPTCPAYLVLVFALWLSKAVAVPINPRWPARQIKSCLALVECSGLIVSSKVTGYSAEADAEPARRDSRRLTVLPAPEDAVNIFDYWQEHFYGKLKPVLFEDLALTLKSSLTAVEADYVRLDLDQDATIMFTSGSSGQPKAVLHTLGNHYYSALGSNSNIKLAPGDCWGLLLPLYHVGGLSIFVRTLLAGAAVATPGAAMSVPEFINKMNITHLSMVATQLYRLLKDEQAVQALSKLKVLLLGGGPLPVRLVRQAKERRIPVYASYGSTEMASQVTATRSGDSLAHRLTSGRLLPYRQLAISLEGEILVRGATLFKEYLDEKGSERESGPDPWFRTGDLGFLDKDGYLTVTGRKDNMFISGGENIQPEQIEKELTEQDGVRQAVVIPVKDEEYGHRPVAFVRMQAGRKLEIEHLKKCLQRRLPRFMVPDRFFSWPQDIKPVGIKFSREDFKKLALKTNSLSV